MHLHSRVLPILNDLALLHDADEAGCLLHLSSSEVCVEEGAINASVGHKASSQHGVEERAGLLVHSAGRQGVHDEPERVVVDEDVVLEKGVDNLNGQLGLAILAQAGDDAGVQLARTRPRLLLVFEQGEQQLACLCPAARLCESLDALVRELAVHGESGAAHVLQRRHGIVLGGGGVCLEEQLPQGRLLHERVHRDVLGEELRLAGLGMLAQKLEAVFVRGHAPHLQLCQHAELV